MLISAKTKMGRFGIVKNLSEKQFNFSIEPNEMPICIYGSIAPRGPEPGKPETSYIELLGFEITADNNPGPEIVDSV